VPLYFQIERTLESHIRSGVLAPGAKLPTEAEMRDEWRVSRSVIRQAIKGLQDKGLVWRSPRKGTFVTENKISQHIMHQLSGFYEDAVAHGAVPRSRILERKVIQVSGKVAHMLEIEEGDQAHFFQRLRFIDGEPMVLSRTYVPFALCPGLIEDDLANASLYALLEGKYHLNLDRSRRMLEAAGANESEANHLGISIGEPLILIRSITYLEGGRPVEYDIGLHRGDRFRFEAEVYRAKDRPADFDLYFEEKDS